MEAFIFVDMVLNTKKLANAYLLLSWILEVQW